MKIVSTGYTKTRSFTDPKAWLERISFYTGILEELAKQYKVESIEQISYSGQLQQGGVMYHFLDLRNQRTLFSRKLNRYIGQLQPDVVLVNGFIFPLRIIYLRLISGRKVKIIVLHRAEKPFRGIKKYLQRLADKFIDAYLFSSMGFKEEWKANINTGKIHEVMQASSIFEVPDKNIGQKNDNVKESPLYLWVGRLDDNKDPLTAVKAFIRYLAWQPSAVLYMIYQTEELLPIIAELIASNGASRSIRLIGKISHEKMQDWYSTADFIISASHYEGSGISVVEAMSCGCVPIVTNIASFRKITNEGNCGFLYEPGNDKQLLEILLKIKELDRGREREKVLHQFNEELSFGAIAGKIDSIIRTL